MVVLCCVVFCVLCWCCSVDYRCGFAIPGMAETPLKSGASTVMALHKSGFPVAPANLSISIPPLFWRLLLEPSALPGGLIQFNLNFKIYCWHAVYFINGQKQKILYHFSHFLCSGSDETNFDALF